jgi:hypothetical protein
MQQNVKRNLFRNIMPFVGVAVGVAAFVGVGDRADAFKIPTGNEEVEARWDNTVRYSLTQRVKGQNSQLLADPNIDDGNRNFDVGIVGNRLDLLSELDFSYRKSYGFRVSGAGWYDQRYHEHLDNTSPNTSNHLVNGQPAVGLSNKTKRLFRGPNGELLDAFAFANLAPGEMPVNLKVGRHTVIWGESLFASGGVQGISYGQAPIDVGKALTLPGVEIKELFRPLNQVSVQFQPVSQLTFAAQYFLQWEPYRMPGAGSYLGFADPIWTGGESILTPPPPVGLGIVRNGGDIEPDQARDWGVMARWSPPSLGGTLGLYYRNFSDKVGQLHISPVTGTYNFSFASDIDLYGISFAEQLGGASIGMEINYRTNMPLVSEAAIIGPFPGATSSSLPGTGGTFGARGKTLHAVVNAAQVVSKTPVFDSAVVVTEFVWDRWLSVTQGAELFKGRDSYTADDRVTKDHLAGTVVFTPTWYQVISGVDLSMPMSVSVGLLGTSAVMAESNNKNAGQYGIGFSADILQRYKVDLTYAGFFGSFTSTPAGVVANSPFGTLKDRDMITLTLKTTF